MAEQHRAVAITAVEAALNTVASTFDTDHPDSLKSRSIIDCLRETAQNMNSRGCLDTAIFKLNKFMSDFGNQQVRVSALTGLGRASEETFNELVDAQSLGYYGVLHDFGEQIAQNSSTVACKILVSLRDQIELQYFRPSLPTQTRSSRDPLVHDFDAPSDITQQPSPTLAFPSGADVGRLGTTSAPSMAEPCSNGRSLRGRSTSHADQKSAIQDNLVPPMRTRACRRRLASEERNLNESETRTVMQSIEPIDLTGEDEDSAQSPPSTQIPTKLDTDRASKRQRVEVRVPPPPIVTPPRSESSDSDTSEYIPRLAPPPPTQTDAPAETEQVKKPQPQPQALSPPSERDATSAVASRSKNTGKAASQKAPEPRREKPISHVLDECINIPHELTQSAQAHLPASLRAQPKTLRMPRETCVCCLKAWTSRDDIKHCHFTGARRACDLCHDTRRKFEQVGLLAILCTLNLC